LRSTAIACGTMQRPGPNRIPFRLCSCFSTTSTSRSSGTDGGSSGTSGHLSTASSSSNCVMKLSMTSQPCSAIKPWTTRAMIRVTVSRSMPRTVEICSSVRDSGHGGRAMRYRPPAPGLYPPRGIRSKMVRQRYRARSLRVSRIAGLRSSDGALAGTLARQRLTIPLRVELWLARVLRKMERWDSGK